MQNFLIIVLCSRPTRALGLASRCRVRRLQTAFRAAAKSSGLPSQSSQPWSLPLHIGVAVGLVGARASDRAREPKMRSNQCMDVIPGSFVVVHGPTHATLLVGPQGHRFYRLHVTPPPLRERACSHSIFTNSLRRAFQFSRSRRRHGWRRGAEEVAARRPARLELRRSQLPELEQVLPIEGVAAAEARLDSDAHVAHRIELGVACTAQQEELVLVPTNDQSCRAASEQEHRTRRWKWGHGGGAGRSLGKAYSAKPCSICRWRPIGMKPAMRRFSSSSAASRALARLLSV